jgi:hypothetical protein
MATQPPFSCRSWNIKGRQNAPLRNVGLTPMEPCASWATAAECGRDMLIRCSGAVPHVPPLVIPSCAGRQVIAERVRPCRVIRRERRVGETLPFDPVREAGARTNSARFALAHSSPPFVTLRPRVAFAHERRVVGSDEGGRV